jgi:signal transduction histidine kinase/phage shock protein PspC (stress-responsive transcriptional regulator)
MASGSLTFARRAERRVVAGVAGGFADQHGVDVFVLRSALVVLSLTGGLGAVLYAVGYFLSTGVPIVDSTNGAPARRRALHPPDQRRTVAVGCIALGAALVMRSTGVWLGDTLMLPLIVAVTGLAVLGVVRPDPAGGSWGGLSAAPLADVMAGKHARVRIVAGAVLVALGLVLVGTRRDLWSGLRAGAFATAVTIVGVALVLGPWLTRAAQEVAEERRQRIRSEEREAMAAHLHDSVLQTLALIQRSADDPRRTVTLARRQERELRQWLFGAHDLDRPTLDGATRAMADEVESLYDIRIEVVIVGDQAMTDGLAALGAALREACVNAAKHSGVGVVSLYVEVGPDGIEAFVRDRGRGFDRSAAPSDRRGIARSILARMERAGGTATVTSAPGNGTEVCLRLPAMSTEGVVQS